MQWLETNSNKKIKRENDAIFGLIDALVVQILIWKPDWLGGFFALKFNPIKQVVELKVHDANLHASGQFGLLFIYESLYPLFTLWSLIENGQDMPTAFLNPNQTVLCPAASGKITRKKRHMVNCLGQHSNPFFGQLKEKSQQISPQMDWMIWVWDYVSRTVNAKCPVQFEAISCAMTCHVGGKGKWENGIFTLLRGYKHVCIHPIHAYTWWQGQFLFEIDWLWNERWWL